MTKKKVGEVGEVGEAKGVSGSTEVVDARTVFVRNLPYSLTDAQLESLFAEVGPVRHCFTVKTKGSDQHRGFGFVQFAVTEDAHKAVQEKNGAQLQSRKIKVEVAKRRAPLDVRHPKSGSLNVEPKILHVEGPSQPDSSKLSPVKSQITPLVESATVEVVKTPNLGSKFRGVVQPNQRKEHVGSYGSSKQRPARTVVVGGLSNTEMLESVLAEGLKAGPIEAIQRNMTELELNSHGLAKDGCKPRAAAIVFLSVKAACKAVTVLHQMTIAGNVVWARQLGGEGSKLKRLRLIVRNLPFQVTEEKLRDLFSPAGFLWEVTIPRKADGLSKGFAFVGFTCKASAEKAIQLVNGKLLGNRPLVVDWAVAKKEYEAAVAPSGPEGPVHAPDVDLYDRESTASESDYINAVDSDGDSVSHEASGEKSDHPIRDLTIKDKQVKLSEKKSKKRRRALELISNDDKFEPDGQSTEPDDVQDQRCPHITKMDQMEEVDFVKQVLNKVVTSAQNHKLSNDEEMVEALQVEHTVHKQVKQPVLLDQKIENMTRSGKKASVAPIMQCTEVHNEDSESSKLSRTVFLRNLPPEAKVPELRKLFSEFGEIKSFRLVINPITKKSKGNAFLEYKVQDSAQAAVAAARKGKSGEPGLLLKGRLVSVTMAVDKDSARKIAKETFHKQIADDKRNLVLAKEGQVLEGTSAAAGVSKSDMSKRQQLQNEKATKLRSPNFHVSRTRLSVHNLPKTMSEKELKQLFLEAVKARASKQSPVIKQVKILRDEDSQKSRGAAFVEFMEHQHALVALRVLNNNPVTFGSDHRPIVEFAIENSLILRKRAKIATAAHAKMMQHKGEGKRKQKQDDVGGKPIKKQKTKGWHENSTLKDVGYVENGRIPGDNDQFKVQKRKRSLDEDISRKARKERRDVLENNSGTGLQNHSEEQQRKFKRGKTSGVDRKAAQARRASGGVLDGEREADKNAVKTSTYLDGQFHHEKTELKDKVSKKVHKLNRGLTGLSQESGPKNSGLQLQVSKMENKGKQRRNSRKPDSQDHLDKLVEEYRTKYFSNAKMSTSKGVGDAPGDFLRWYE